MIIGRGDIASAITDREGFTFFCAGVSNREPISDRARHNELNRIWRMNQTQGMFVYFSTLSIFYVNDLTGASRQYTEHKIDMENLVRRTFDNYAIVRIGNITWGSNPNTIVNYLKAKINNDEPYEVKDVYRYLVDKDEFNHWVDQLPPNGKVETAITGRMMKVEQIVKEIKDEKL